MATRTALGRAGAVGARTLFVSLTLAAWLCGDAARAQRFIPGGSILPTEEIQFAPAEQAQPANVSAPVDMPTWWDEGAVDSGSYDSGSYGCGDSCCDTCGGGGGLTSTCPCLNYAGSDVWWFGADYLIWRIDGSILPPLVTDSPILTVPALGSTTTRIISGGEEQGNAWRSGYRLRAGVWLDACHEVSLSGDYFQLGDDDYNFYFAGDSGRNTGRPYFNTQFGVQTVRPISGAYFNIDDPTTPILVDGTVSVSTEDDFHGAGLTLEHSVYAIGDVSGNGPGTQVSIICGYRFYSYDSQLSIADHVSTFNGPDAGESRKRDDFFTSNEFHGGEIGALFRFTEQRCWFEGLAKVAVGGQRSSATIHGETATVPALMPPALDEGGLLTSEETNIGQHVNTYGRVIPEFRAEAGYFITPNCVARAGYSILVWSNVARAAGQMPPNLAVDPRNIPPDGTGNGGAAPLFPGLGGSELVAHGLDLSIEYRY